MPGLFCNHHVDRPEVEHGWDCELLAGHPGPHREVIEYVVWWDDEGNEVRPPTHGKGTNDGAASTGR